MDPEYWDTDWKYRHYNTIRQFVNDDQGLVKCVKHAPNLRTFRYYLNRQPFKWGGLGARPIEDFMRDTIYMEHSGEKG